MSDLFHYDAITEQICDAQIDSIKKFFSGVSKTNKIICFYGGAGNGVRECLLKIEEKAKKKHWKNILTAKRVDLRNFLDQSKAQKEFDKLCKDLGFKNFLSYGVKGFDDPFIREWHEQFPNGRNVILFFDHGEELGLSKHKIQQELFFNAVIMPLSSITIENRVLIFVSQVGVDPNKWSNSFITNDHIFGMPVQSINLDEKRFGELQESAKKNRSIEIALRAISKMDHSTWDENISIYWEKFIKNADVNNKAFANVKEELINLNYLGIDEHIKEPFNTLLKVYRDNLIAIELNDQQQPAYNPHDPLQVKIFNCLIRYFDDNELDELIFSLQLDDEITQVEKKDSKARNLIANLRHQGRLNKLIYWMKRGRPNVGDIQNL